jgi:hypothetical protein
VFKYNYKIRSLEILSSYNLEFLAKIFTKIVERFCQQSTFYIFAKIFVLRENLRKNFRFSPKFLHKFRKIFSKIFAKNENFRMI